MVPADNVPAATAAATTPGSAVPAAVPATPVAATGTTPGATPAPGTSFTESAKSGLVDAYGALGQVNAAIGQQTVHMDHDAARALKKAVRTAKEQVDALQKLARTQLDAPLLFGDNWVGRLIAERLRLVANGDGQSAASVLGAYRDVLDDVENTINQAAQLWADVDHDTGHAVGGAQSAGGAG